MAALSRRARLDDEPEYWAIVCPAGGKHEIVSVTRFIYELETIRICSKCGLRDTFIEEAE